FDDNIPDIDPDPEFYALFRIEPGVAFGHPRLDFARAAQRVDDAAELDQEAVAGGLDDAAVMRGDPRVEQRGADRLQAFERAFLVAAAQQRVADHIRGQDSGKTAGSGHGPAIAVAAPSLIIPDRRYAQAYSKPTLSSSSIRHATTGKALRFLIF